MSDKIKELITKSQDYDALLIRAKGYGYDSLCLRYIIARNAQMQYEIEKDRHENGGFKIGQIKSLAERDKQRFFEILNDLIGEHD